MRELALFAGAGGGILGGLLLGWRTVCAVEIDAYCRRLDQLGQPVPYFGGVWLHKQVAEILGTHARLITFPGCQWRERDPNTLTETEIRALEQSHGWAIERPLLSSRCSGNANQ